MKLKISIIYKAGLHVYRFTGKKTLLCMYWEYCGLHPPVFKGSLNFKRDAAPIELQKPRGVGLKNFPFYVLRSYGSHPPVFVVPTHLDPIPEDSNLFNFYDLRGPLYIYNCITYTIV